MTTRHNTLQPPAAIPPRLLYPRKEAANQLGISVRSLDYYVLQGKLKTRRMGSRVLIPHEELVRFASGDQDGTT